MRKQSGFTLIELMVVMAIIAILATAGLAAYGGYIKKARDSNRLTDLKAIESVVQASLTTNGSAPSLENLVTFIVGMNNGQLIHDPLWNATDGNKEVCMNEGSESGYACNYMYAPCDNGGYILRTRFESASNVPMYSNDALLTSDTIINAPDTYDLGSCDGFVDDIAPAEIS